MRITDSDNNFEQVNKNLLEPRVLKLLEKLGNKTLLIEQLTLKDNQPLSLKPAQSSLLSQIEIPKSLIKAIAPFTQHVFELKLNNQQRLVTLSIAQPQSSQQAALEAEAKLPPLQLTFQQAKLIHGEILRLSHLVNFPLNQQTSNLTNTGIVSNTSPLTSSSNLTANSPVPNVSDSSQVSNTKSIHAETIKPLTNIDTKTPTQLDKNSLISSTSKNDLTNPNQPISLKQAVNALLSAGNAESKPLAQGIKQVNQLLTQLLHNFNSKPTLSQLPASQPNNSFNLSPKATQQFIQVAAQLPNADKITKSVAKLIQLTQQLTESIDFSKQNNKLNLDQRVANSGNFLEANFAKNLNKQTIRQTGNTSETNNIAPKLINKDLKLLHLITQQTLQGLLKLLNAPNARPVLTQLTLQQALPLSESQPNPSQINTLINQFVSSVESEGDTGQKLQLLAKELQNNLVGQDKNIINKPLTLSREYELLALTQQKQLINDMLTEIKSSLARIETNQLLSLRSESQILQQYLLDLPIQHKGKIDSFELLLEAEQDNQKTKKNKRWNVTIKFDLEPLGPMFARVELRNQRISTHFYAENEVTANLLTENLEHLKNALFIAGIDIDELKSKQADVPESLTEMVSTGEEPSKIDIKV